MLSRRKLFGGLLVGAAAVVPTAAESATKKSVTYMVPANVKRIRVRSWKGDREILNTSFSEEPGQMFRIEAT